MEIFSFAASKASQLRSWACVSASTVYKFSFLCLQQRARKIVLEKRKHKKCFNLERWKLRLLWLCRLELVVMSWNWNFQVSQQLIRDFSNFFFVLQFECLSYDDDRTVNTYMHRLCHRRETILNCKEIRLINTHSPATDLMHNMVNCRF